MENIDFNTIDVSTSNHLPEDIYTKKITIDWIRHAESCANLDSNNFLDKNQYPNRVIGYDTLNPSKINVTEPESKSIKKTIKTVGTRMKAFSKYHPNLSFIGTQQAILLGSTLMDSQINYDAVFTSPTIRAIMTALLAFRGFKVTIYVVPFISEGLNMTGNYDNQNTALRSDLLKKQVLFIKDWLEKNWILNFDDIHVMNTLIDLRRSMSILVDNNSAQQIVQIIDSILSCKPELFEQKVPIDEYPERCDIITKIESIIPILQQKFIDEDSSYSIIDPSITRAFNSLQQILDPKFLRGPTVNFEIVERFEKEAEKETPNTDKFYIHKKIREPDMNKFYQNVLPTIFDMNILNRNYGTINIACVSHGGALKKYFGEKYTSRNIQNIYNTQTIREILTIVNSKLKPYSIDYSFYIPPKIRTMYGNFERLNSDICRLESLKGILNYPLYSKSWESKIKPILSPSDAPPAAYATNDVKFYFNDVDKYHNISDSSVSGGSGINYYYKYQKYKTKINQLLEKKN
uniref:Histidine phosphatase domain-containing protein n=1 Tax=Borely moumouvirus TaxID=2712067 RepID=A0A6G6ADL7_9VIRU